MLSPFGARGRVIASKFIFTKNERFYPTPNPPQGGESEKSSDFERIALKIAAKKPFSPLPESGTLKSAQSGGLGDG
jgi:hypothetical protein